MYKKWKNENVTLRKRASLVISWYAMIPTAVVLLLSAFIFYENDFAKPAVWIAIYAAIIRNLWGFFLASLITGMAFGIGCKYEMRSDIFRRLHICSFTSVSGIVKDAMSHPIFRSLGRLTFCAYLIHPAIIRLCIGSLRQPIYASDETILVQVFAVFVLSYTAALFLCLGLELPTSALLRHFAGKDINDRTFR